MKQNVARVKAAMNDAAFPMQIRQAHEQLVNYGADGKRRQDRRYTSAAISPDEVE